MAQVVNPMRLVQKRGGLNPAELVPLLLAWFRGNARDLPWRRTADPYAIWVSEIMLQQTQVQTVLPYYRKWMEELPTIGSLVKARSSRIHTLWAGLGYYTRVRNMQRAAREIVEKHKSEFPERFDDILALPGIGRYTAGAICSIAFGQPTPILDGNVTRVLTRLFGVGGNPREKKISADLWRLARILVESAAVLKGRSNCSHLNQALMELGALVCTPRQPKCGTCPVNFRCTAYLEGRVGELPELPRRAKTTERRFVAFVIESNGRYFVRQRPNEVVNGHLWEFPNCELSDGRDVGPCVAARAVLGCQPNSLAAALTVKHTITRYRITMEVYRARMTSPGRLRQSMGRWCSLEQLNRLPFPSAHRRVVNWLSRMPENNS